MTQCPICLTNYRDPVCIPCGHVFCKRCLTDHANVPENDRLDTECPVCRSSFDLVAPDLTYLPEKYHKFVTHSVRRIYADFSSANELRESLEAAQNSLSQKAATEQALLTRCEELTKTLYAHRKGERDANQRILELEGKIANMEKLQIHGPMDVKMEEKEGHDLLTARIITDETFSQHKTFDLAVFGDGNQLLSDLPTFCVSKQETYSLFKSRVAQHFNHPEKQIRLWVLVNRQNKTVRPETRIRESEPSLSLENIRKTMAARQKDLLLYLDVLPKVLPKDAGTIMIFFKHFDTTKQTLVGVGKTHVPRARKVSTLIPIINKRMGWISGIPLKLYEEVKPGMVELLKPNRTFTQSEIQDGDIVCFQMVISFKEARDLESRGMHSNPKHFYNSLRSRVIKD